MTRENEAGAPERQPCPQYTPKNDLTVAIGNRLRAKREEAGKTVKEMCELLGGISLTAYRMYENGGSTMRADMLIAAATHLGCDPSDLITLPASSSDAA